MALESSATDGGTVVAALKAALGGQHVLTDKESLELLSFDFSELPGSPVIAVVRPGTAAEVAEAAKLCSSKGFSVLPRGGGMSYTLGYVPQRDNSVIIDLCRMNRIAEINTEDLYITVEAGVTWKQIHEALLDTDYRPPFMGTFSGALATVGGGIGNNCVGLGQGEVNDCLLGVEVVKTASVEEVIRESELVTTSTPSREPFVKAEWLHPGLHITAMGSDAEHKQELYPEVIGKADLVVCDRKSQCFRLGELHHALDAGIISEDSEVYELGELTAGQHPGRQSDEQITVCDLTGVGVQDTAISLLAYKKALEKGVGIQIEG